MPAVVATKVPSIAADYACAVFAYWIVRQNSHSRNAALLAYMALLLAPTAILNGSYWGQADSIYAAGILASLYGLISKRSWIATTAFGVALAFKLQAVFFLPLLLALTLRKQVAWKHWFVVPAVLFLAVLPAWAAGGDIYRLLTIYLRQAQDYPALSMNAPTLYAWIPSAPDKFRLFFPAGMAFAVAIVVIFVSLIVHSKIRMSRQLVVELAALCVILVPFVTPKMHERYFFLADMLSIVLAFYVPALFHVALIVNLCSFFSYSYLLQGQFDEPWLALAMLFALVVVVKDCLIQLYPATDLGLPHEGVAEHP